MARQYPARRADIEKTPSPAAHAGFWPVRVIIGHDIVDDHDPGKASSGGLDGRGRGIELPAARQQRGAIAQRPAVILNMRDFEAVGAKFYREVNDLAEPVEILAVHDSVDGQW